MNFKKIACATAILATVCFQGSSFANERYVSVGVDDTGNPFLLDTTTMGKVEKGFGRVIKVYQVNDNSMEELLLRPACGDRRLWIVGSRTYSNNIKISENKQREEIPATGDRPGSNAMRYYCRSINARGW